MSGKPFAAAALVAASLSLAAVPVMAETKTKRVLVCDKDVKKSANTGTVVGALGGGLLGSAVAGRGAKTEGAILGAGIGAVTGHQIAKKNAKKNCYYVTKKY
jgi:uncharacterized protein YcfJ